MALEFNITAADRFFIGEDKVVDFIIYGPDNATPLDMSDLDLEWSLRKTDKLPEPPLLVKSPEDGMEIVGVFSEDPLLNTQRVRLVFTPDETRVLKENFAYRHSLKRMDTGNESVLSYGDFTLLRATEY